MRRSFFVVGMLVQLWGVMLVQHWVGILEKCYMGLMVLCNGFVQDQEYKEYKISCQQITLCLSFPFATTNTPFWFF